MSRHSDATAQAGRSLRPGLEAMEMLLDPTTRAGAADLLAAPALCCQQI